MSSVEVRPFRRSDREQLTALVNAHVQAVVPGVSVSVNTVMSQLERDPGEFIVDPWVTDRVTLVAEQRRRVVAAAHLLRYGAGEEVGDAYRDAGEINWLVHRPAAGQLLARLGRGSRPPRGRLPGAAAPLGCHQMAGGRGAARTRDLRRARAVAARPRPLSADRLRPARPHRGRAARPGRPAAPAGRAAAAGMETRRTVGVNGTRLSACLGEEVLGYVEVEANLADGGRLAQLGGWADVGNLHVAERYRRRGVATWLVGQAADWLRLARVERLLDYATTDQHDYLALLRRLGFRELTRTARGWTHPGP